ncbi:MAG: hypothetical protein RMJ15_04315 [Nitrososphaerota archaeon]|nr:hypothetical protein [Nitrososphaerota archaeon]
MVCVECGENFLKPVLASVLLGDSLTTYYACPRCLAKVEDGNSPKHKEKERAADERKAERDVSETTECKHFLGYLKKRPKNTPIPDGCLTCDKIIECLL